MQKDLVGEDNMTKWASHGPMANPSVALGTKIGPMPGELVAVCGRVAAGKSSLLLAMLGEMKVTRLPLCACQAVRHLMLP